ncbi:MAG: class I SAM-dependent methyltransferase [Bacteroidetes bacterium]|nr:class I SAM-dependent methyltransferase [Bacteroidota bacterium]
MKRIPVELCPVCGYHEFNPFLTCKDFLITHESFSLEKCLRCGFTLTNPQPTLEEIGNYYLSENYISHTGGNQNLFDRLYKKIRLHMLKKKRALIEQNSTGLKILDIGCGTGDFLKEMKENSWTAMGVEPSETARLKAQEKELKIVKHIDEIEGDTFSAITLWHVLEHLHNPNEYLKKIYSLLSSSGKLIIAVPNLESYDANHYKEYWAAYDVPRHLWHFNKTTIKKMIEQYGFELKEIKPLKFDSFYVSWLSEIHIHPNRSKIVSAIFAFCLGVLSNIKAMKNKNYSSLIYIASKCEKKY